MSPVPIPSAPRRPSQSARDFSAARSAYLAGAEAEAVCRRHDIRTSYFLRIAAEQGWRRPDPEPAPAVQNQPLVIPEAPRGAIRDGAEAASPLTAAQMADKAWAMLSAAVAAGRLIEARGWLRLHRDLQPHVREEAAALREAEQAPDEAIALPLHCFSSPACNGPHSPHASPCHPGSANGAIRDGTARQPPGPVRPGAPPGTRPGSGRDDKDAGPPRPLHCFSASACNAAPGPPAAAAQSDP
ncbi:MAG: hypothetical protein ACK4FB_14705, partial [Brevundimonas sp.]|uniref:hypothetical protein n=1 Tax=Brevundimonas sp. TaxID=1871086 RepID=UPI00391CFB51